MRILWVVCKDTLLTKLPVLQAKALGKGFTEAGVKRRLFDNLDFQLHSGERVALLGESGCGKSTLLNLLAGLEPADSGEILLMGQTIDARNADQAARLRRQHIGFIFQAFHLLPQLDCLANVMVPLLLQRRSLTEARSQASQALQKVGLEKRAHASVASLSGGEQQRTALARAIVHAPCILLADEPTGNLDSRNASQVLELLTELTSTEGCALLMVTHSEAAAQMCTRQLQLDADGLHPGPAGPLG